ncbi:MAG TPA: NAD(P)/FAD-dependent oxidoreductase [Kofleriaceae bacterium]
MTYDVAVIGGGPAGLAGALALCRARKRVVLFDAWPPRNAAATEVRGYVTQDGTPPAELRRLALDQLAAYDTFELRDDDRVAAIRREVQRFAVVGRTSSAVVRRVLLAVGLVDQLPDIPGYRALWGTSVFQCPYCHGWELRDRAFGYLAPSTGAADWALLLRAWTRDLVIFTNGAFELDAALAGELRRARIRVEPRPIAELRIERDRLAAVRLVDGAEVPRDVLFVRPPQYQTSLVRSLVDSLGLRLDARDLVHTDELQTSVPGIYAAGDLMMREHGATVAAAAGSRAAHELDQELTRELVLEGAL